MLDSCYNKKFFNKNRIDHLCDIIERNHHEVEQNKNQAGDKKKTKTLLVYRGAIKELTKDLESFVIWANQKYFGYELNDYFVNKLRKKYNQNNIYFSKKNIDEINFEKFDPEKTVILLIGIFHHIDDVTITKFLSKTKNFKIVSIDAVILPGQNFITKLLFFLDKGNFIRKLSDYKKIISGFDYKVLHNRYLRFPYDHLMCFKNINRTDVEKALGIIDY